MKIKYDINLYKKIANFPVDDIVQVSNRKGKRSTIHIKNIVNLSWHELQLLVSSGTDRFTKMVLLYNEYADNKKIEHSVIKGNPLSQEEKKEIKDYISIFRDYNCNEHYDVNKIISENDAWDNFKTIRSLNDHGEFKEIEGIQPKYFEIICDILGISGGQGRSLDKFKPY